MSPQAPEVDVLDVARRLESLVAELESRPDEPSLARTRELARLLTDLHGAALARIVATLRGGHPQALAGLLEDDVVESVLVLHDLHPEPVRERIEKALARLGRTTRMRLTLVDLGPESAQVHAELDASARGTAPREVERMVREAVHAMAPEIERVDVRSDTVGGPLVQIQRSRTTPSTEAVS